MCLIVYAWRKETVQLLFNRSPLFFATGPWNPPTWKDYLASDNYLVNPDTVLVLTFTLTPLFPHTNYTVFYFPLLNLYCTLPTSVVTKLTDVVLTFPRQQAETITSRSDVVAITADSCDSWISLPQHITHFQIGRCFIQDIRIGCLSSIGFWVYFYRVTSSLEKWNCQGHWQWLGCHWKKRLNSIGEITSRASTNTWWKMQTICFTTLEEKFNI